MSKEDDDKVAVVHPCTSLQSKLLQKICSDAACRAKHELTNVL